MKLTLRDITPTPFRHMADEYHSFAILRDGQRCGTVLYFRGQAFGDPPNRWKALIQTPAAFRRGAGRMPVLARFDCKQRDGLLPQIRAHLEKD